MRRSRGLPVNRHAEAYGVALSWGAHDEMKIARVKATHDPTVGTAEDSRLPADRPLACQRPPIQREARRRGIEAALIAVGAARRHEMRRPLVSDVIFRGSQIVPIRRHLDTAGINRHDAIASAARAGFGQQPLNGRFRAMVLALAEVMLANASVRVDEIEGGPVLVLEGAPDRVIVIDHDRILDLHLPHGTTNVVEVVFESELGCVHSYQDEALPVLL